MSRFQKLSHVLWHCQYHIVFVPKYRHRVLTEDIGKFVYRSIYVHTERSGCEVVDLEFLFLSINANNWIQNDMSMLESSRKVWKVN